MNHAIPNLQIHIHKVDGATTTFIQNDADEVKKNTRWIRANAYF